MVTVKIEPKILCYCTKNYDFTARFFGNRNMRAGRFLVNYTDENLALCFRKMEDSLFTSIAPHMPVKKTEIVRLSTYSEQFGFTLKLRPIVVDNDIGYLRMRSKEPKLEKKLGIQPDGRYSSEQLDFIFKSGLRLRGQTFISIEAGYVYQNRLYLLARLCEIRCLTLEQISTFWDQALGGLTSGIEWVSEEESEGEASSSSASTTSSSFDNPPDTKRAKRK
jgi:hypothetical protein